MSNNDQHVKTRELEKLDNLVFNLPLEKNSKTSPVTLQG
jgi:hypothetical protein